MVELRPETVEVWLCDDCTLHLANVCPDPTWTLDYSCPECWEEGVECAHPGWVREEFVTGPCARCATPLAGARTRHAYHPPFPAKRRGDAIEVGDVLTFPPGPGAWGNSMRVVADVRPGPFEGAMEVVTLHPDTLRSAGTWYVDANGEYLRHDLPIPSRTCCANGSWSITADSHGHPLPLGRACDLHWEEVVGALQSGGYFAVANRLGND